MEVAMRMKMAWKKTKRREAARRRARTRRRLQRRVTKKRKELKLAKPRTKVMEKQTREKLLKSTSWRLSRATCPSTGGSQRLNADTYDVGELFAARLATLSLFTKMSTTCLSLPRSCATPYRQGQADLLLLLPQALRLPWRLHLE